MSDTTDRREFLKTTIGAGLGAAVAATGAPAAASQAPAPAAGQKTLAAPPIDRVRVGIIGLGNQGSSHLSNFLKVPNAEVRALCDLVPAKVERGLAACAKAGAPKPATYTGGPEEWRKLCDSDLDLVYIVTPWELHAPMCVEAMKKGKHAATEVPMAPTLAECWQLVETSESTRRHCVMMENCCYDREEMMILNMVRQGVFGELLHAECGYLHDLRTHKLSPTYYEGRWRLAHSVRRNGDLYPTHGLGPVCQWLDVNRGNRLESLVSVSTKSRGLESLGREDVRTGQPGREAEVRPWRRGQHLHPHEPWRDDPRDARHEHAAAVQPEDSAPGHKGCRAEVPAPTPRLHRGHEPA